ncbi:hypothetical protein L249_6070 [Ophiocordyceps polyrhachis-furcata BCC 54312]|uniref:Uncharacterized protein n=1 Tax=Ophiocordyceps polyrhachis-furcata BCC 54312 TaxID=1330021 RepID=A0A367LIA7_9HYPO|nr:hypothetical protein L249_6070 [Ophiocordyceps polyrhachis-furcata BCC 54312]
MGSLRPSKSVDEPPDNPPRCPGIKALLAFATQRIMRGGARSLVLFAAMLLVVPALMRLSPTSWHPSWNRSQATGDSLRIVVFGSQDLLGSASGRPTWTKQLCIELGCSSYVSLVPPAGSSHGLTSNGIYADELGKLQKRMKETDVAKSPAWNYSFVSEQYPVPAQTPDLEAQVKRFLSRRPAAAATSAVVAPHRTLWVFTFGTWDVWNLAALPRELGERAVDALVLHLFSQIELLYGESLHGRSIAYSDFEARVAKPADPGAGPESFRVVIPDLLDVTLMPGWQRRPDPPAPHSKAEQMRNAAFLTRQWNSKVAQELERWVAKGKTKSAVGEEGKEGDLRKPIKGQLMNPPYPRRTGLRSTPAATILDTMTEQEVQRSREQATATVFLDVWKPCVEGDETCSTPDTHLFHDAFTVGQRMAEGAARMTAEKISRELMASVW